MILTTCKYFDLVGNRCSRVTDGKCNDLQDCEFKFIEALKTENERLKEKNQSLSILGIAFKSANEIVRKEFFRADKNKDMWREKAEKLQQTLQEIKAIAEECMDRGRCFDCKYSDDCYIEDAVIPTYDVCKLLIQKITKAESEG